MPENNENNLKTESNSRVLFSWVIPEFTDHQRSASWYFVAILLAIIFIIYCIFTSNYFFALIIILATFVVFLRKYNKPREILFQINDDGILFGEQFFPYNELDNFYFVYNPPIKKLYFKLKKLSPDDISVPLADNNPLPIRAKLLEYMKEDLEREQETFSDIFETILKL